MNKKTKNNEKGFSLSALSNTRGYVMGIATLMIVFFHSYISFSKLMPDAPGWALFFDRFRQLCVCGVDIFLILSGIGLYYSLSKNKSLKDFYKKRATRILPAVMLVSIYWFAQKGSTGIGPYLKNVTFISFYTDGVRYFWYFALIIFLYAIYPLIHKLIEHTGVYGALALIAVTVTGTLMLKKFDYQQYLYIEIALTRIPVFIVGAWLGKLVKDGVRIPYFVIAIMAVVFLITAFIGYYYLGKWNVNNAINSGTVTLLKRITGNLHGITLTFIFAAIFRKCKQNALTTFLTWIGVYSMELYLVHEKLGILMYTKITTGDPSHILYYGIIFILSIPIAMALKAFTDNLNKNLFYKNPKKEK